MEYIADEQRCRTRKVRSAPAAVARTPSQLVIKIDRGTTLTLHVRRGESNLFVPIRGETARG